MKKTTLLLAASLVLFSCSQKEKHHKHHHRFDDAQKWAKVFEDEKRSSWQEPTKVFKAVGLKSNSISADIGSATGFFPVRIAKKSKSGRVWGVDIEPNLIRFLNDRALKEKIPNLFSILGTMDDPLIPEPVDFIFIVNTYHHIGHRDEYFNRLKHYLKKNGQVVIIDFRKGDLPFGPKDKMKISKKEIIVEMTNSGYKLKSSHDFLKYQNLLVFKAL